MKAHARARIASTPLECSELFNAVRATEHIPGDMAEVGVYCGGTAIVMLEASPARQLHLFDTFSGLPHDEGELRAGEYAGTLATVQRARARVQSRPVACGAVPATPAPRWPI